MSPSWIDQVKWDERGLVTAVAQDAGSGRVLMVAWMNRQSLEETASTRQAVYFSRSRNRLWRKGEESGNTQTVREIRLDCDGDVILLQVEQHGGIACHTGRESCMYQRLEAARSDKGFEWIAVDPVLKDPDTLYAKKSDPTSHG
jgi:phosphoribosyl-AMP cyclohydrolase